MNDDLAALKRRADQLVSSYGTIGSLTKLEEAIDQLGEIWEIDAVEMQVHRPNLGITLSNILKKAASLAADTGVGAATKHSIEVARVNGAAEKVAAAAGKLSEAKTGLATAGKAVVGVLKKNPKTAIAMTVIGSGVSFASAQAFKLQLKRFNEACYEIRRQSLGPNSI
jgi:hypothetical protein